MEEKRRRGVHRPCEQSAPNCSARVSKPSRRGGGSLLLSAGFLTPRVREATLIYSRISFPFFLISQSAVRSKYSQAKEGPMNLSLGSGFEQHQHPDTSVDLKRVPCASVGWGCGLRRCLQWLPELSVGDPALRMSPTTGLRLGSTVVISGGPPTGSPFEQQKGGRGIALD